ncbi:hypothetical protein KEM48_012981 [Puccinia striiformis f. sp. tritici PST-130]|nr:hypothetical protein KEM48_012981 [Puccinia striiformis f. sp. tritici PST-130]
MMGVKNHRQNSQKPINLIPMVNSVPLKFDDWENTVGDDIIDEGMHEAINALKGHSYSIVIFHKALFVTPNAESPP